MSDRPTLIVLDGHAMNPGDLDWAPLGELTDLQVHERTPADQTIERAQGAELLLTNKVALGPRELDELPGLRYIGVTATGYNVVDLAAARAQGITVTNVPAYSTESVAQLVFAHILHQTQQVALHSDSARRGDWAACADFCYWKSPLMELHGRVIGIIGFGAIGQATARIARAFGMQVLVHTRTERPTEGVRFTGLDELLRTSDIVSLHCPLTEQTEKLINADRLGLMKPSAILINTGRGPLIDEAALADALREGRLAGAGVDVLSTEPPSAENPLLSAPNCAVTPHIGWATRAARERLLKTTIANVAAFLRGEPQNVVS